MKPWLKELKVEDLRGDYAELAEVIGLEKTVLVAEELGGAPLLLPCIEIHTVDDLRSGYLDLHPIIGWELTVKVAEMIAPRCSGKAGGQLYLPQAKHVLQATKERYVKEHDKVSNRRLLSRETGISLRHVYRICQETTKRAAKRREENPNQLSLLEQP